MLVFWEQNVPPYVGWYNSVKNERLLKKYTFFAEKSTIIWLIQKNILPLHRKLKPYYYESGENTID